MTEPIEWPTSTPLHALPLLFAGQAQKEFFVNAALARCDALIHPVIEGEVATPPPEPADGEGWLVATGGTGAFAGRDGQLAFRQAGTWIFADPRDGMRVLDRSTGQQVLRASAWRREEAVTAPTGGQTIDQEARTAIDQLIGALSRTGILPEN